MKIKAQNPMLWLLEPFASREDLFQRKMFGCEAIYLGPKLVLVLANGSEPWNGALFPVEHELQPQVIQDYPVLHPHPILGKWLYLSQAHEDFETLAPELIQKILKGDPRFGVVPKPKKKKRLPRTRK